jgi:serine/threonine protein kinase
MARVQVKGLRRSIREDIVYSGVGRTRAGPRNGRQSPLTFDRTVTEPTSPPHDVAELAAALTGQYEIEREVGRGGMGIVYLARDLKLQRHVAIKTLPPHLMGDANIRERFLREARTAGALSHQNIVPIHRADELAGQVFFVMGFVDGESMAQHIKDRGRLDPLEVVRALRDVAMALAYAHTHGVIHRDVKAENILIERQSGRALVTDFGIARLAEATPLTSTGQVLGTVYYLSPEQVSGDPVDARADIYSLGVAGYFALSGRFPFEGDLASAVLVSHVTKMAPPLHTVAPDVPRALTAIIDRCLAKNPAERFQSCMELGDALGRIEPQIEAESRTRDVTPSIGTTPALLSDTEAQAIWKRAADLQANTGVQPRPDLVVGERDREKDAARTSGYRLADVRDAAAEAGIGDPYLEHALAERGLSNVVAPPAKPPKVIESGSPESMFVGAQTKIELEIVVDGEMPEDDFILLTEVIRRVTATPGQAAAVGRAFSWQAHPEKRTLQVSVIPRGGKTTIGVSENLKPLAGGTFGGAMGPIGAMSAAIFTGIGAKMHDPLAAVLMWVGTISLAYAGARLTFGRISRTRQTEVRELADALATQARESIAAATGKTDEPTIRRLRG